MKTPAPPRLALLLLAAVTMAGTTGPPWPPTMVKQPPHELLYVVARSPDEYDRPFVLECEAGGNPQPSYSWTKNGQPFHHDRYGDRITQQPQRGSLVFTNPGDEDEGLYQCQATNIYGTSVSNAVWVRKAWIGEVMSSEPKVVRAVEGEHISLDCEPHVGGYPPLQFLWVIMHSNGALRNVNSSSLAVDPDGRLHFSSVEMDHQLSDAVYACTATSAFRHEYKILSKVQLEVEPVPSARSTEHAPVQQYVSSSNLKAIRGHTLRLYCIFGGKPLPEITWSKRGTESLSPSERFRYANSKRTLEIKSLSFEDEGTYECHASNGVGADQTHAIHVEVEAAPYWLRVPNSTVAVVGQSVRFECAASGVPTPELQWLLNGVPIEKAEPNPRLKVEGPVLSIETLTISDTAVFQCNASNPHGYAFMDFYVNVAGA